MLEKLLLHIVYECHRNKVDIPWDKVMARLAPGSTPDSAMQHMNKTREYMITEGHMVPPLKQKRGSPQDADIRGIIRDMTSEEPSETRVVGWDEEIEDRKANLEVPGIIRGSGKYPRTPRKSKSKSEDGDENADETTPSTSKKRGRKADGDETSSAEVTPIKKTKKSGGKRKTIKSEESVSEHDVCPEDLISDEDYEPNAKVKRNKHGRRIVKKPVAQRESSQLSQEELEGIDEEGENEEVEDETRTMSLSPEGQEAFLAGAPDNRGFVNGLQYYEPDDDEENAPQEYDGYPDRDHSMYPQSELPYPRIYEDESARNGVEMGEYNFGDGSQYGNVMGVGYQPGPTNPTNYMTGYQAYGQPSYYASRYLGMSQEPATQSSQPTSSSTSSFGSSGYPPLDLYGFSSTMQGYTNSPVSPKEVA